VLATLKGIIDELDGLLASLDPRALHSNDAAALLDAFVALERRAAAGKTLVADRAAASDDFIHSGSRSAEDWLAAKTGTSFGEAKSQLESSSKLKDLPAVSDALRNGELSSAQLNALGPVATPENENRLLASARNDGHKGLKKACEKERFANRSADEERRRHERIHRERSFRSWTDPEGAYCFAGRTTADVGARLDAAVAAEAERVFKDARAAGRYEPACAYRLDALVNLVEGEGAAVATEVVIRVDEAKLRGEPGGCATEAGPVPVDVAIGEILANAFVKIIATDGVDVTRVFHVGRDIPAILKTAIVERDAGRCVRPGCDSSHRLEVHHYKIDYREKGPTIYSNLATLCRRDHRLVTYGGHRLIGDPGAWEWIEPP
jgi:hypothetical protein